MFFKVNFYNANQQLMRLPSLSLHCFFPNKSSSGVLNVASSPPCGPVRLPSPGPILFLGVFEASRGKADRHGTRLARLTAMARISALSKPLPVKHPLFPQVAK